VCVCVCVCVCEGAGWGGDWGVMFNEGWILGSGSVECIDGVVS
jgi:hypothetical protein